VIQTGGNNKIRIEDKFGSERVMVESPASNSWIRVGATNDPIILNGNSPLFHNKTTPYTDQGALTDPIDGSDGITVSFTEIKDPSGSATDSSGAPYLQVNNTVEGVWSLKYVSGDDTAIRKVIVYDPTDDDATEELKGTISDGIRIRSSGNLWLEAQSRIGNYYAGKPPFGPTKPKTDSPAPSQIGDLIANFSDGYNPTGLRNHVTNLDESLTAALAAGHVHVSSLDTFNTQEGNIYDFGGYWNYNLGNSYAEDHIDQTAVLNMHHKVPSKAPEFTAEAAVSYVLSVLLPPAVAIVAVNSVSKGGAAMSATAAGGFALVGGIVGAALAGLVTASVGGQNDDPVAKGIGDVIAGPNSGPISTWANKVGSSFEEKKQLDKSSFSPVQYGKQTEASLKKRLDAVLGSGAALFGVNEDPSLTMNTSNTWVEKKFGDSYSFTQGNSIEITHGSSEEHVKGDQYEYKYGGIRESMSFTGDGLKTAWEKSGSGKSQEMHWDRITGQCTSYEYKDSGHFSFSLSLPTLPKLAINVSLATLDASIDLSAGMSMSFKAAAAMAMNVSLTAGLSIDFERSIGGKFINDETTNGFEFKAVGMAAKKEAELEAKRKNLDLIKTMTDIHSGEIKLEHGKMKMGKSGMYMDLSDFKFF
jgi:hypothetical protein